MSDRVKLGEAMQGSDAQTLDQRHINHNEVPTCPVCMEKLGTYGGPSSLACGHNGCLECLQQVQAHSAAPLCPLCRTPFDADLTLGLNLNLRDVLERLDFASLETVRYMSDNPAKHVMTDYQQRQLPVSHEQYGSQLYEGISTWTPVLAPQKDNMDGSTHIINAFPCDGRDQGESHAVGNVEHFRPKVNFWNLVNGMLAILSRRMRPTTEQESSEDSHLYRAYFGGAGGEMGQGSGDLWASVHLPSAPPLLTGPGEDVRALRATLEAEPPQWVPDSACSKCLQCNAKFQPLMRGRHHCRFCGQIFCRSCSTGKCLLPVKFRERDPQRVCDICYERLEPIQQILIDHVSNAAQVAIHDVTDFTSMRGWLNNPLGLCMQQEIYKATNTLRNFCKIGSLKPEKSIPEAVLQGAKGLAILTVVKVGMVLTYKLGTGLIVARRDDGSWSPPSAIVSCGLGWGLQVGGELIDFIIVLRNTKAVKAFSGRAHLSIGAGLSAAVGPLGRLAEADLCVGDGGATACYTYSCSQGAFVGVSFEGNVVAAHLDTNTRFYGDTYLTPEDILFGSVPMPRAAAPLYGALYDLFAKVGP